MWKVREWLRPSSPEQAAQLLAQLGPKGRLVAGGTRISPQSEVEFLVDISKLPMKEVSAGGSSLRLGSGISLQALATFEPVRRLAGGILALATRHTYTALVRNRATLGGEIATAEPTSEILAALLALQASVELLTPEPRSIPLSSYLADHGAFLASLITAVSIPMDWNAGGLARVARTVSDRPIVSAAFAYRGGAQGGLGSLGLVGGAERVLGFAVEFQQAPSGQEVVARIEGALSPPSDIRGSAQYRGQVIPVVVRRAVQAALEVVR